MENRRFGNTDLMVSPITFGAWSIGGPSQISGKQVGWAGVDDSVSVKALETAFDLGINTFDTADAYAKGHSEKLIGKALSAKRSKIIISTKVGMVDTPSESFTLDFSRKHMVEACENSLRNLKTDYIDIYLLHMVVDGYPLTDETKDTMETLKSQGKIRHYGVSVQFPKQGKEQLVKEFGDAMMIEYNMLTDSTVEDVMTLAESKGTGVITRGALSKGLLTGKYKVGQRFPEDDVRSRLPGEYIDNVLRNVNKLSEYTDKIGSDLLSIALGYQLKQSGCSTVTIGLKTPNQVQEVVKSIEYVADYNWSEITKIMRE